MPPDRDDPIPDSPSQGGWSDPGEPAVDDAPPAVPSRRYTVGALLGRGGMGAVYAARDTTLGRDVALKELQPELAGDPGAGARLAREAAVTSRLDHPGIVSVHDAGRLPDGRPFYTMRLVRGRTLARAAAEATTPEARRQLVRHVLAAADAVAAAHDAGVVHRDLKPANILLGAHGETQVVDWGLATPTPAAASRWADLPASAARGPVGTPPYMAPEQARGELPDPRHDVWSLGTTLALTVGGARRELPAELAAIVARATHPAPEARYPDAAAFADDLLRWFEGRRVAAHTYTSTELLRRTLSAYRLPLAVGAAGLLALSVAVGVGWWQTTRSLDRALVAEADARASLADLRLEQAVTATRAGARETAERLALAVLREREDPLARGVFAAFGRSERPALLREEAGPPCAWAALPTGSGWVLCGGADAVSRWEAGRVAWTVPIAAVGGEVQGDHVLVWDAADTTWALDVDTGLERGRWPLGQGDWVSQVSPRRVSTEGFDPTLAPSGCATNLQVIAVSEGRLAAVCGDGTLLLGTTAHPAQVRVPTEMVGDQVAMSLAWTPDGAVVAGTLRGRVFVYAGDTGTLLATSATELGTIGALRVSRDGRHVALGGTLGGVGLWDLDTASLVGEIPATRPRAFAFAEGGLRVLEGSRGDDATIRTWAIPGGAPSVVRGPAGLADLVVSDDATQLVTAGGDGGVTTIDLRDGRTHRTLLGDRVVKAVALAGTRILASGMAEPRLAVWSAETAAWSVLAGARPLRRLVWVESAIVGADLHAGLYRWSDPAAPPEHLASDRVFVDIERSGTAVVVLDARGQVDRLEGTSFRPLATVPDARAVALQGQHLAIALENAVEIHDLAATAEHRVLPAPGASLHDVALSADGARVAAAGLDGTVRVWDVASGRLLGLLPGHTERVVALEFLADGDLASASWDKSARIWALRELDRPVETLAAQVEAAWGPE